MGGASRDGREKRWGLAKGGAVVRICMVFYGRVCRLVGEQACFFSFFFFSFGCDSQRFFCFHPAPLYGHARRHVRRPPSLSRVQGAIPRQPPTADDQPLRKKPTPEAPNTRGHKHDRKSSRTPPPPCGTPGLTVGGGKKIQVKTKQNRRKERPLPQSPTLFSLFSPVRARGRLEKKKKKP